MVLHKPSLEEAENYLRQLDELTRQLEHARNEFGERLQRYRYEPNPRNQVDLQSSIAYFQKHIDPIIIQQQTQERRFTESFGTLVIGIDREWRAYEFRQLFQSIDYLNKIYVIRHKLARRSPELRLRREMTRSQVYRRSLLFYYLTSHEEIQVKSIQFASPGSISFEGLGDAINAVRDLVHYAVTFQFVKGFVDLWDHFQYDRKIERAEKRMKLKTVIQREKRQDRNIAMEELDEYGEFLTKMNEIADLAIELDKKGLAKGFLVEESAMNMISKLHRLGFDERKLRLADPEG